MQLSRVLLLGVMFGHYVLTDAKHFSIVATTLGAVALAALKIYFGQKLFSLRHDHSSARPSVDPASFPALVQSRFPESSSFGFPSGTGDRIADDSRMSKVVVLPIAFNPRDLAEGSKRVRRDLTGGIKLNKRFLKWLKAIDDEKCIHRFFCDLGADQNKFGNVGRLTNMLVIMGGLQEDSWAQDMYDAGQDGKPCPQMCDEKELSKTVAYLERHFFAPSAPVEDSETLENEVFT